MVIKEATKVVINKQKPDVVTTEADRFLLEPCFEIPRFGSEVTAKVYRKTATHNLCRKGSLQNLHSSKKLSTCPYLCSLIQEGASTLDIHTEASFSSWLSQSSCGDTGVPLPAKNLIFKDGILSEWSGRSPSSFLIANLHLQ